MKYKNDYYIYTWKKGRMKNIYKFYLLSFILLSDFVMYAQPGDDDGGGGLEGDDPQPAPINGKLVLLLVLGLSFAFYNFKMNSKKSL